MTSRRPVNPRFAAAVALTAALACALPAAAGAARRAQLDPRPNIVVLMTDDQTLESLRVMRATQQFLAGRGTTFERAIATYPLCCPSRATYLTGQYSHNHGVIHNAGPYGGHKRLDHSNALPVWLQNAGYRTIHLGRYLNGYGTNGVAPTEVPPGWTDWHSTVDPTTFHYYNWLMNDNGTVRGYPEVEGEHQNDFFGRRAAQLIEDAAPADQPFFLSLTFPAPHSGWPRDADDPPGPRSPSPAKRHRDAFANEPLPRPPNFDEEDVSDKPGVVYDRPRLTTEQIAAIEENYRQELETLLSVDDAVAKVIDALLRTGELGRTLVIFTSDNGFLHGEHRWPTEKVLPYEPVIRVPLIMRGPGVPRGRRDRRLVANIDVAPTIVDAADAAPGRLLDGRSLFPLMADRGREWGRDILLENGFGANRVPAYRAIRNERFLYVRHVKTREQELYDLRRDPYELENLDGDFRYEAVQRELARRLRLLRRCRGAACRARPALALLVRAGRQRRSTGGRRGRGRRPAGGAPVRPSQRRRRRARCVRGDLRVEVAGLDRRKLARADFFLGRRRLGIDRRAPFARKVSRRRLRRGRQVRLRARAITRYGRTVTLDRRLRVCRR